MDDDRRRGEEETDVVGVVASTCLRKYLFVGGSKGGVDELMDL